MRVFGLQEQIEAPKGTPRGAENMLTEHSKSSGRI